MIATRQIANDGEEIGSLEKKPSHMAPAETSAPTTTVPAAPAPRPETPAEKLVRVSRLYFWLGFLGLPWLWFANALMIYQYRNKPHAPASLRWYRNASAALFAVAAVLFAIYVILARTALVGVVPWIIRPGVLPDGVRQDGLFSQAALSKK